MKHREGLWKKRHGYYVTYETESSGKVLFADDLVQRRTPTYLNAETPGNVSCNS